MVNTAKLLLMNINEEGFARWFTDLHPRLNFEIKKSADANTFRILRGGFTASILILNLMQVNYREKKILLGSK